MCVCFLRKRERMWVDVKSRHTRGAPLKRGGPTKKNAKGERSLLSPSLPCAVAGSAFFRFPLDMKVERGEPMASVWHTAHPMLAGHDVRNRCRNETWARRRNRKTTEKRHTHEDGNGNKRKMLRRARNVDEVLKCVAAYASTSTVPRGVRYPLA